MNYYYKGKLWIDFGLHHCQTNPYTYYLGVPSIQAHPWLLIIQQMRWSVYLACNFLRGGDTTGQKQHHRPMVTCLNLKMVYSTIFPAKGPMGYTSPPCLRQIHPLPNQENDATVDIWWSWIFLSPSLSDSCTSLIYFCTHRNWCISTPYTHDLQECGCCCAKSSQRFLSWLVPRVPGVRSMSDCRLFILQHLQMFICCSLFLLFNMIMSRVK